MNTSGMKCANCHGSHEANSLEGPYVVDAYEIEQRHTNGESYAKAKEKVNEQRDSARFVLQGSQSLAGEEESRRDDSQNRSLSYSTVLQRNIESRVTGTPKELRKRIQLHTQEM